MEIQLKTETLRCFLPVFTEVIAGEYAAETVVPDTMPDIARILDTAAAVFLRERTVADGKITLEGEIHAAILYLGEDGDRIRKLDLRVPWSLSAEDERIRGADVLTAEVRLASATGRALNPRKVGLSAEVAAAVAVYRDSFVQIPTGTDDPEIQTLTRRQKLGCIAAIREKGFTVTEELSLPAAAGGIDAILCYRTEAAVEETKPVAGKLILQGNVHILMQYLDTDGAPQQERFAVPFSQLMDLPEEGAEFSRVIIQSDACWLETVQGTYGTSAVHLETHLIAQGLFIAEREIDLLTDAYSVHHPCILKKETAELFGAVRPVVLRETLRDMMETPETPSELLYGRSEAALPVRREKGVELPVSVRALYRCGEGQLASAGRAVEAEFPLALADGEELMLDAPASGEPYFSLSAGGVEFRLPTELRGVSMERKKLELICGIELDEEAEVLPQDAPSLILVRLGDEGLWTLAKRYNSTEELIRAVNPEAEAGDLLLIPRAR